MFSLVPEDRKGRFQNADATFQTDSFRERAIQTYSIRQSVILYEFTSFRSTRIDQGLTSEDLPPQPRRTSVLLPDPRNRERRRLSFRPLAKSEHPRRTFDDAPRFPMPAGPMPEC